MRVEEYSNDLTARDFNGRLRICSLANNERATHVYERHGFKAYEVIYEKLLRTKK